MSNAAATTSVCESVPEVPDIAMAKAPAWIWVHVAIAALAMVATLPGRTHGLGLITEPLMNDLQLGRVPYATINLWATLLGAAFCLPCGWLIDRIGIRTVLTGVTGALGIVVLLMSAIHGVNITISPVWLDGAESTVMIDLFVLVLLTRGLGQSALSVVSLALVGQAAGRKAGWRIGVYSCLTAVGFMTAFAVIKYDLGTLEVDWRTLWGGIGCCLLIFAVLSWILVRPGISGWSTEASDATAAIVTVPSLSLGEALSTPAFWVFALATSLYGMIVAGISLFNQSILSERGFDRDVFLTITMVSPIIGLAANLATGWLATQWRMTGILTLAMVVLMTGLLAFPYVKTLTNVYFYAAAMGGAGGMVTVIFFAIWGQTFGPAHLGKIQGAAQMMTVFASAGGPLLLAVCQEQTGSYLLFFQVAAGISGAFAIAAWWTPLPSLVKSPAPVASLESAPSQNITILRT